MTAAERAERARRSGFDHDISGIDDTQVYRPLVRCTTKKYQQQWDTWMEYVLVPNFTYSLTLRLTIHCVTQIHKGPS